MTGRIIPRISAKQNEVCESNNVNHLKTRLLNEVTTIHTQKVLQKP